MSNACGILSRRVCFLGCAALFAAALATAQSAPNPSGSAGWSSSQSGFQVAEAIAPASPAASVANTASLPSAPAPAAAQQDQDQNTYSGWKGHDLVNRLTIEAGFGAGAPAGDKQYITWGPGFLVGAGVNFNRNFATFIEYQFLDNKVPGAIIAESGTTGGHYHIWGFGAEPVVDLFPKSGNDLYIEGGGGFYRKTTNFTVLEASEFCSYFYCAEGYSPQTVGKLSSNQGGFNFGGGYQHRFGGMYGESRTRFFAEVRYLEVLSPAEQGKSPSGGLNPVTIAADTKLLPITLGIRW